MVDMEGMVVLHLRYRAEWDQSIQQAAFECIEGYTNLAYHS